MAKRDQDEFVNSRLPGTGGDFIDTQDVEGHRAIRAPQGESMRQATELEGEGISRQPLVDENDVEGHRWTKAHEGGESELTKRGPSDNPHGER